jgi:hypothetical protein
MKSINWHIIDKKAAKRACIIFVIGIIYLIWYRFTNIGFPCIFYKLTKLYCPGCGITRMLSGLLHLDFAKAFKSNCLAFLLLPYGSFVFIRHYTYLLLKGKRYQYKRYHKTVLLIILILTVAFGIARNIPYLYFLRPI